MREDAVEHGPLPFREFGSLLRAIKLRGGRDGHTPHVHGGTEGLAVLVDSFRILDAALLRAEESHQRTDVLAAADQDDAGIGHFRHLLGTAFHIGIVEGLHLLDGIRLRLLRPFRLLFLLRNRLPDRRITGHELDVALAQLDGFQMPELHTEFHQRITVRLRITVPGRNGSSIGTVGQRIERKVRKMLQVPLLQNRVAAAGQHIESDGQRQIGQRGNDHEKHPFFHIRTAYK